MLLPMSSPSVNMRLCLNVICRLKTDNVTIYISIYNRKAQILGLEGKEYTLNKVADVYSLVNIEDKSGKYS